MKLRNLGQKLFLLNYILLTLQQQPNPPNWPSSVIVINEQTTNAQAQLNQIYAELGGQNPTDNGQFSSSRYAVLFEPGNYGNLQVNVGYYTSIIGLGTSPQDTTFTYFACQEGGFDYTVGALDTFWRSAENIQVSPTTSWFGYTAFLWAVSQASPLRRVYVDGNLLLYQYQEGCCAGYASGGYLGDSIVTGNIMSGSQQQWLTRNAQMASWINGVWNIVYVGSTGAQAGSCQTGKCLFTNVQSTPVIAEKPYLIYQNNKYYIVVPSLETNKVGPTPNWQNGNQIDFAQVYVATPEDTADSINAQLSQGLHLLLTPGIYNLTSSIVVNNSNTVVLGIGFPTLISGNGNPAIVVGNADGVRVAGILFQAGQQQTSTLLQVGEQGYAGNQSNPVVLSDIFARVGGPNNQSVYQVQADCMVIINSGYTILDNSWLWRADHTISGEVYNGNNPVQNGLIVNGDNVVAYGLAVEHTLQDLVQWNGNNGQVYFYQSEYPYDVTQDNYGNQNYVSYRVADNVTSHSAYGVGAYSYFRDNAVTVNSGFAAPNATNVTFTNAFTVFLNGNGQINHVINNQGGEVSSGAQLSYVCSFTDGVGQTPSLDNKFLNFK